MQEKTKYDYHLAAVADT